MEKLDLKYDKWIQFMQNPSSNVLPETSKTEGLNTSTPEPSISKSSSVLSLEALEKENYDLKFAMDSIKIKVISFSRYIFH